MKISKLIKTLEKTKKKYGDIPVSVYEPQQLEDGFLTPVEAYLQFYTDENEKVTNLVIVDEETADTGMPY
jgi:4-aminobutyrate aminotransferase-like enzyme